MCSRDGLALNRAQKTSLWPRGRRQSESSAEFRLTTARPLLRNESGKSSSVFWSRRWASKLWFIERRRFNSKCFPNMIVHAIRLKTASPITMILSTSPQRSKISMMLAEANLSANRHCLMDSLSWRICGDDAREL